MDRRSTFSVLRREQIEARKEYDALISVATGILTREDWPKIEAATARMQRADDAVLRFLRGEPVEQP